MDLFGRLVDGVFDFLKFYFADYVEAVVGCHGVFPCRFYYAGEGRLSADVPLNQKPCSLIHTLTSTSTPMTAMRSFAAPRLPASARFWPSGLVKGRILD